MSSEESRPYFIRDVVSMCDNPDCNKQAPGWVDFKGNPHPPTDWVENVNGKDFCSVGCRDIATRNGANHS